MHHPYADDPSTSGWMDFSEKDMEAILRDSLQSNDQLLVHIVGDRSVKTFLDAMDATGGKAVWSKRRVRIEHGEGITPDLVARVRDLGIVVVKNPTHFTLRDLFIRRFGLETTERLQPFRSLLDADIPVAIGSDGPNNPYLNLMFASNVPGRPQQSMTREQVIIAYTLTSAYAEFAEKDKGSLEPGKLADLAVLSQDIFRVEAPELPKTKSLLTMAGGKIVYDTKTLSIQ
jgi:predicted amidohydrolase YtcJ